MKNLVIVESPAKGKTIEKYLGPDYIVRASVGHIRDLKKKEMGINLDTFEPDYIVSDDKKKVVTELKRIAKTSDQVWIATDEDREGEAIGWHLCEVLGLDPKTAKRVKYSEITKKAIQEAFKKPLTIDQSLVDAQQARRILDRIVGFEVSPVLWRKIPGQGGLSAGRVQSVAVRLVVDREKEIEAFVPKESWRVSAECEHDKKILTIDLAKKNGKKATFKKQEDVATVLDEIGVDISTLPEGKNKFGNILRKGDVSTNFSLTDVTKNATKRTPAAPFTTSTLQQEASRKHGFSVKQTMAVAQGLYQNGVITYMRTDSMNLSAEAMSMSLSYIESTYGAEYALPGGRKFKTKDSGAQEAHEAIRPTDTSKTPANSGLSGNDLKLYTLIWQRTVASQMKEAKIETTTYSFSPEGVPTQEWQAKGQVIVFDGFMKLYVEGNDDEEEEDGEQTLPALKKGDAISAKSMIANQSFSRPPARFTEAALVKKLESEGIGRPSTYAPTISTIQDRGYIEKQKKHLYPTSLARIVTEYLEQNFVQMMDYGFTAKVEAEFDKIAQGDLKWKEMLKGFYGDFHDHVVKAQGSERMTGEREIGKDPKTGKPVLARMGRYGPMVQIGTKDDEEKPQFASIPAQFNIESITLDDAMTLFTLPRVLGKYKDTDIDLKANIGRFGPYVQKEKTYASIPVKFEEGEEEYDAFSISLEQATKLMEEKLDLDAKKHIATFDGGIEILRGRYGPYLKFDGGNYKIPKDKLEDAEKLTEQECRDIIENSEPTGRGRARTKKKKK